MKHKFILLSCFLLFATVHCSKPKEQYYIPDKISKENKRNLIAYFDQGKMLFKNNCASCHGIYGQGKDSIPNFSQSQLDTYKAKLAMKDGQTNSFADSLSYDQIEQFLKLLGIRKE